MRFMGMGHYLVNQVINTKIEQYNTDSFNRITTTPIK